MEPVTTTVKTVMDAARLEAFVDGALSPEEAARTVLHLADCPGDRAYVDAMMEMNALLAAAYGDPIHQALPEKLRATIYPSVAPSPAARPAAARPWGWLRRGARPAVWAALAASVAFAFGLATWFAPGRDPAVSIAGLAGAETELRAALETNLDYADATPADGARITITATFFAVDGRPCREFEVLDAEALTQGLACREAGGDWTPEIAVATRLAAAKAPGPGFVPAAGESGDALGAALDRLEAGPRLEQAEVRELIAAGWAN